MVGDHGRAQTGIDAVPQGYAGDRHVGLQAFVDDLGLQDLGVRYVLADGDPP